MIIKPILQTERLILRQWCDEDFEPFAALMQTLKSWNIFRQLLVEMKALR
ncbi:MAG: hypothetical protein J0H93_00295 [Chlamydiales bacterium]|nr:hypothetical protein [Chlamydiales bacterium]